MRKHLLDIPIDWLSRDALIRQLKRFVLSRRPHQITTVNPEFIVRAQKDRQFKEILGQSDLSLPDGTGVVLAQTFFDRVDSRSWSIRLVTYLATASQFLTTPHSLPYRRVTGVELAEIILNLSRDEKWPVFLLGAGPGVAEQAATVWRKRYPGVKIVGTSSADPQDHRAVAEIKAARPDVLMVAYGAPKQELFIAHHGRNLNVPIMVGVGGTFDYAAGVILRPPFWMRRLGLEWLWRLIQQPRRFGRIYSSTVSFSRLVINHKN